MMFLQLVETVEKHGGLFRLEGKNRIQVMFATEENNKQFVSKMKQLDEPVKLTPSRFDTLVEVELEDVLR